METLTDKFTDKELLEAEKLAVETDPLFLVEGGFLTIKTKSGELVS